MIEKAIKNGQKIGLQTAIEMRSWGTLGHSRLEMWKLNQPQTVKVPVLRESSVAPLNDENTHPKKDVEALPSETVTQKPTLEQLETSAIGGSAAAPLTIGERRKKATEEIVELPEIPDSEVEYLRCLSILFMQ